MADMPDEKPSNAMPYVVSVIILFLLGIILIGGVLYLRPATDPLVVIGVVFGFLISSGASIAAFIKSQETHLTVNSQLTAWKKEFYQMAHGEGVIQGTRDEQDRIVEQKRAASLKQEPRTVAPVPVEIVSPDPLPVEVKPAK